MTPPQTLQVLSLGVSMVLAPVLAQAEIYKWTDANGQTHYSSNKAEAGQGSTTQIKVAPAPPVPVNTQDSLPQLEHERRFNQLSEKPNPLPSYVPPRPTRSRSGGREDGTDASRCALARDVIEGKLRYGNGKPIDQYGRDTAQNDISLFCH